MDVTGRTLLAGGEGGEAGLLSLINDLTSQNLAIVWIIVGLLILINFLWELFTDFMEHIFYIKNRHLLVMLEKLYKELTVVGLWSVFLFVITIGFGVKNDTLKHVFELIHISLFGLVLIYIGTMIFIAVLSLIMFKRWRILEGYEQDKVERDFQFMEEYKKTTNCLYRRLNIMFYFRYRLFKSRYNYYLFRQYFITQLSLRDSFHFDAYLRRAMKGTFIELAQIHWSVLGFVLVCQLAIWGAFAVVFPHHNGIPYTVLAALVFVACILLNWKITEAYARLKAHPDLWDMPGEHSHGHADAHESDPSQPDLALAKIALNDSAINNLHSSTDVELQEMAVDDDKDFHFRQHDSSTDDGAATNSDKGDRRIRQFTRRQPTLHNLHRAPSVNSELDNSTSSWDSSWESVSENHNATNNEMRDSRYIDQYRKYRKNRRRIVATKEHHHGSDLYWMSLCFRLITCYYTKDDVRAYFKTTPHQRLFWCNSIGLFLYLCHLSIFWQATMIALIIGSLAQIVEMSYFYQIFVILTTLVNLFYFIPNIVYHYSFCTNVGEFTKRDYIIEVEKSERKIRKNKRHIVPSEDIDESSSRSVIEEEEEEVMSGNYTTGATKSPKRASFSMSNSVSSSSFTDSELV